MSLRISRIEFVAMMAMTIATVAFSVDAMLPSMPEIADALSPDDPNAVQLILTAFVFGMGVGTLFTGPLSDSFGRKPVIVGGALVYIISSLVCWQADSLELLLAARFTQGLGAAGPRVVALAIIRDLYAGRGMARLMSFIMLVFTVIPAVAPLIGAGIIALVGWRGIFLAFVLFSLVSVTWITRRLDEPLPAHRRRPFRVRALKEALAELAATPAVRVSIVTLSLVFGMMLSMLSSVQQIYDQTFDRAASFPVWFAALSLIGGSASLINATLVMKLGMRFLATVALTGQMVLSLTMVAVSLIGPPDVIYFGFFVVWQTSIFFQLGLTIGNLNSIALEPVGHIAGMAASIVSCISTVMGVLIAVPVGLAFDGTPLPMALGICVMALISVVMMRSLHRIERAADEAPAE